MKKVDNYARVTGYLKKIWKMINEKYFHGELSDVEITVQSSASTWGHISTSKVWKTVDGKAMFEINISPEGLTRPIEDTVVTLIHECSHQWDIQHGLHDVSSNGFYHNKIFKKTAEEMGHIIIDKDPRYGWTISSPSMDTLQFCIDNQLKDIELYRDTPYSFKGIGGTDKNGGATATTIRPKGSNSIKWTCPVCGAIIRSTREVNVICGDCGEKFVRA